jgi:hypothetical protein
MRATWLILLLIPFSVYSQQPACSCRFQSILSAGLAAGESPVKPIFQWSGGINLNDRFFAGVGGGIDPYRFKSVPVFADLRMSFGKSQAGFLYSNIGYSFPYDNTSIESWDDPFRTTEKFTGGFYLDVGIGYRLKLKSWNRLLFSSGFSHKRVSNIIGYTYPCFMPPCTEDISKYQYDLGRIVMKVSWELTKPRH